MTRMRIRIDFDSGGSIGPGKIMLLERIRETGSISAAGRALNMSYRRAWLLVDDMNRIFREPVVSAAPERPVHPVRCGTPLERALAALRLPDRLPVILSTGEQRMADLVWSCGPYRPDAPSLCEITGSVFVEGVADPARLRVRQLVRVLPKDMTTPPDKTALYQAMQRLQQAARTAEDGRRAQLETLLTRAESFNALTGAVQHDVDV